MTNAVSKINGLTGLANLGNTCFLNSCMQVLSNLDDLNKIFSLKESLINERLSDKNNKLYSSALLTNEWVELKNLMWSKNCVISPGKFVKNVQKIAMEKDRDIFTGYAQNDLPEFLLFIFESFNEALSTKVSVIISGTEQNETDILAKKSYNMIKTLYEKEYSPLLDLFYGISVSTIMSENGKLLSTTPEPFMMLSLPLPEEKNITLESCINLYCKKEKLDGENAWLNDKTNEKEVVSKGILFWSLPNILIIDLKRFTNGMRKRQDLINIPLDDLDLTSYVIGYNRRAYIYDLHAVCNHEGGMMGGHYTSTIRKEDGKWYNYNDTTVKEVPKSRVISSKAYCLFYKKKHL